MRFLLFSLFLSILLFSTSCQSSGSGQTENSASPDAELLNPKQIIQLESRLMRLGHAMTGDFNNFEQAEVIRSEGLEEEYTLGFAQNQVIHTRRVWPRRTDAIWLYSEVAMAAMEDRPLLQKLMGIRKISPDTLAMYTYILPKPQNRIGEWKKPIEERFANISPTNLKRRTGCVTFLVETEKGVFESINKGNWCEQPMGRVVKVREYVSYHPSGMQVRYEGVDAEGEYIWNDPEGKKMELKREPVLND